MSLKQIFSGVFQDEKGQSWIKTSYVEKYTNQEPLPKWLNVRNIYVRMNRNGDISSRIDSGVIPHPWQTQRFAFLIAARYKNGKYFHVLKLIVCFL